MSCCCCGADMADVMCGTEICALPLDSAADEVTMAPLTCTMPPDSAGKPTVVAAMRSVAVPPCIVPHVCRQRRPRPRSARDVTAREAVPHATCVRVPERAWDQAPAWREYTKRAIARLPPAEQPGCGLGTDSRHRQCNCNCAVCHSGHRMQSQVLEAHRATTTVGNTHTRAQDKAYTHSTSRGER